MLAGHQVVVHGYKQAVYGTVLLSKEQSSELIIDIGAKSDDDARCYIQEGDPIHFNNYHQEMINGYLCGRALDNRIGAFVVLEALKKAKDRGFKIGIYAATTVGEETTFRGAHWAACRINPNLTISVDTTYAQDYPGAKPQESGQERDLSLHSFPFRFAICIHQEKFVVCEIWKTQLSCWQNFCVG